MTDLFDEALKKLEVNQKLEWRSGQREKFLALLRDKLEFRNGSWRTKTGAAVEVNTYIGARLEDGQFLKMKNSTKEQYSPAFPIREASKKLSMTKATRALLDKVFANEGYVFAEGTKDAFADAIAENFVAHDGRDGLAFSLVTDTPCGTFCGEKQYSLSELFSELGATKHLQREMTRISQLSRTAALREKAIRMMPTDAKSKDIENLVSELQALEKSMNLKTNRTLPPFNKAAVESEFSKLYDMNGSDRSQTVSMTRASMNQLNDLTPIKMKVAQIQPTNHSEAYEF